MYIPIEDQIGIQPIGSSSTTQNHPLGTIVRAYDPTFGQGEFIYLEGVVGTVVGSLVTYDQLNAKTALAPNTANLAQSAAVAMGATVASQFGWYQIAGAAVITKTATKVSPSVSLFLSATAGSVMATAASGKEVLNCRSVNAATALSAAATITAQINRPLLQGQVT